MRNFDPHNVAETILLLNENGIQTEAIFEPIGCTFHPSPQDIVKMIQDSDAFFARECALTKEDYQDWKKFIAEGCQCTATTRGGTRCRKMVKKYTELSPQRYVERRNTDDLHCGVHSS